MKWMKAVLCSVLLGATGAAVSSDEVKESPADYVTGVTLETTGTSPWYRVSLPPAVYPGTAWADLRDVRVFNHLGETVPFTLVAQKTQPVTPEAVALRFFPLDMSPVAPREEGNEAETLLFYVRRAALKFICKVMMSKRSARAIY